MRIVFIDYVMRLQPSYHAAGNGGCESRKCAAKCAYILVPGILPGGGKRRMLWLYALPGLKEVPMRIATFAGLVVLLSSSFAALGQVSPFAVEGGQVVRTASPECPLSMHVRQAAGGQMIATDKSGAQVKMFAAHLRLQLSDSRPNRTSQRMVNATVTVRGWNGKAKVLPADSSFAPNGDLVKTFTVQLTGGGLPDALAELHLPGFTAARMVELESITFDDGQVWSFKGSSACRAAPDPFMPVGSSK